MNIQEVSARIIAAAEELKRNSERLSALDAETGDGDHGVTIAKIASAIQTACKTEANTTFDELFNACFNQIMLVNGGSVGPLWAEMFSGMADAAEGQQVLDEKLLKELYNGALMGLNEISTAKAGEKTMKDALIPACKAALSCNGNCEEIALAAADAAEKGAESTKAMVAKFGRARYLKEDSIGHLDPGAVSVSVMLRALTKGD